MDPLVGLLKPIPQSDRWIPPKLRFDQSVVAVAPSNPLRRRQIVASLEFDARNRRHGVDKLVDRHHLRTPNVERRLDRAVGKSAGALDPVIDEHEATRLLAIAPDLNLVTARDHGLGDLSTDGGGSLFATALPCALGPVDVVISADADRRAKVVAVIES